MRWPALITVLAALLVLPSAASARVEHVFYNSVIPMRIDHLIGFTPTTYAIHPPTQRVVPISVTVAGRRHRFVFDNAAAAVGPSANVYLRGMLADLRDPSPLGVFLDRKLKAGKERRYLEVKLDLARDADVLAVTRDHPACATGISRAAAKGIANGSIRSWSAAGVPTPPGGDSISLWRSGTGTDRFVEPRFGAGYKLPSGAKKSPYNGLGEAASGDTSAAAVTSWSRARGYGSGICAVPVGGSAPTDASVRSLSYAAAYPISFVAPKRLKDVRAVTAAFVKYLAGPRATEAFRQRGMLLVKDEWPAVAQGEPTPF